MVKKDWELNRLKQLKEEEERKAEEEDEDEMMYTYTKTEVRTKTKSKKPFLTNPHKKTGKRMLVTTTTTSAGINRSNKPSSYAAERPKRTTAAMTTRNQETLEKKRQKTSKLLVKKAVQICSPVKKTNVAEKRSIVYKKSISTGNMIENELNKYRKLNEKIEKQTALKMEKQRKKGSKLNTSNSSVDAQNDSISKSKSLT